MILGNRLLQTHIFFFFFGKLSSILLSRGTRALIYAYMFVLHVEGNVSGFIFLL